MRVGEIDVDREPLDPVSVQAYDGQRSPAATHSVELGQSMASAGVSWLTTPGAMRTHRADAQRCRRASTVRPRRSLRPSHRRHGRTGSGCRRFQRFHVLPSPGVSTPYALILHS
jgi:hypothetical protein